jgi:hypothetical protein
MPDFEREIKITASYDQRHEPDDQHGAHGADLFFILRGELGAVTARLSTGWVAHPLAGHLSPATVPLKARLPKPGVDAPLRDIYPSGAGVFAHSIAERQNSASEDTCDILPGGKCWCTGGYLIADEVLKTLVTMGSDGVWHQLESYYQEWIADEPVKEPGDG